MSGVRIKESAYIYSLLFLISECVFLLISPMKFMFLCVVKFVDRRCWCFLLLLTP